MITTNAVQEINILIVSPKAVIMRTWLVDELKGFNINFKLALSCDEGFDLFNKNKPALVIVDGDVEDMNAMSFVTIIKDTAAGNYCKCYLYHVDKILQNTKADFYCINENDAELRETMRAQVRAFLNSRYMKYNHADEIQIAKSKQLEQLPKSINNAFFSVYNIFSPLSELSGDGLDYWLSKDEKGFYGFLFDCTGHDLMSFTQGGSLRMLLKKGCMFFQTGHLSSLSEVFHDVNNDLFDLDVDPMIAAAVMFYIDCENNKLTCCSAGIPSLYLKYTADTELQPFLMKNYLLGFAPNMNYDETEIDLSDVTELMFTSDGFSELFFHRNNLPKENIAKHDDVSAIKIIFKRQHEYSLLKKN